MNKQLKQVFCFLAVLILPALCQASTTILSNASPDHTVTSGSDEQVYGTSASNQIVLESGAKAELINFPGQNSIQIQSSLNLFTVSRSGTVVTFQGADGTVLKIPATTDIQIIEFSDIGPLTLSIHNGQVMLGDHPGQVITPTPVYLGDPELSVTPSSRNVGSESGTTTFSVSNTGVDTMAWTAEVTSGNNWLTIISGESGSDSGTISCRYDANVETDPRTGVIRITATGASGSPMDVTVTQQAQVSCAYNIFPTSDSFSADGESKSISVTPSSSTCTWTTSESLSWVSLSPTSGTGSGDVTVSVDPNTGDARSGSVTIAGETYEISQEHAPCTYSISPTSGSFDSSGGSSSVSVTASISSCSWSASESPDWITLSPTSGTGSGSVTITTTENAGVARTGSITIAGETYSVSQAAPCTYNLSSLSNTFASSGGTLTVFINASSSSCEWTASEGLDWVSLSPTSGIGNGTVTITVAANTGTVRRGSVTLAGLTYSINQEERPPCTYSISPSSGSFSSGGGTITVSVTASSTSCEWTASESLDWISLSPTSGTGDETLTITSTENTGDARSGSISMAGETYEISQDEAYSEDSCGAYIAPGVWKEFDCYNLAAIGKTTGADPFIPSWELVGGYWQWGRKGPDPDQQNWYNANTQHFAHGPTGPGIDDANSGSTNGWDDDFAPDGAWSDSVKTANDPCPARYRVPTEIQWEGVDDNNTQSIVGTWDWDDTNYSSGRFFGEKLLLPAAGNRHYYFSGALSRRGYSGYYWSSSEISNDHAWGLYFGSSYAASYINTRRYGFSVRCVAE
jgi:uncharacterized protein (TIGR02145 family)